jgi:hypothetical protein
MAAQRAVQFPGVDQDINPTAIGRTVHLLYQPGHTDDRDHLFRSIATSVARALTAPLDGGGDVSLLMAGQAR